MVLPNALKRDAATDKKGGQGQLETTLALGDLRSKGAGWENGELNLNSDYHRRSMTGALDFQ